MNNIVYVGRNMMTYSMKQHSHDEWELVYCTGGRGQFEFKDLTLKYAAGDIAVIPPNTPHTNVSSGGFTNIHINISEATLPFKEPMIISDDSEHHILGIFNDSLYFFNSDINSKQLIIAAFGNLIVSYMIAFQNTKPLRDVVDAIRSSITQNFTDCDYELDKFLRTIPFSYDYLRKLFKSEMGMTPHNYLTNLRMQLAEKLLCSSDSLEQNISQIAYVCGYSEPLYFSRVFKKHFGCSPKNYATRHKNKE